MLSLLNEILYNPTLSTREKGLLPGLSRFTPSADIIETPEEIQVYVDLPGFKENDIHVSVENQILTVKAESSKGTSESGSKYYLSERSCGSCTRSFRLSSYVDGDATTAHLENGVLTIKIPKRGEMKPKAIPVTTN